MRTKLLTIVAVLLLSGSGDARPQRTEESTQAQPSKASNEQWRTSSGVHTVREDSRYTWNSGNSSIPYTNYYRDNIDRFVERVDEVSVTRPRKSKPTNSSRSQTKSSVNLVEETIENTGSKILDNFNDSSKRFQKHRNATRHRDAFRGHSIIPMIKHRNSTNSSSKQSDQSFRSSYARVPLLNPRIPYLERTAGEMYTTKDTSSEDYSSDNASRRTSGILMNNSRSNLTQNSKFSDQKEDLSPGFDNGAAKVESTTPFDHVAAIKKITSMLSHEKTISELFLESKNSMDHGSLSIPPQKNHSNRHSSSKNPNRIKIRHPQGPQTNVNKKNQNKVNLNKIQPSKSNSSKPDLNLKNWPNGAIQNAEDFQNYDKYTSIENLKPEEPNQRPVPLKNATLNYHVPISSPSLQEIVHWLKIPAFMTNGSHIVESDHVSGPISVAFDPIYQNLEPNRPLKPSNLQGLKPGFIFPLHSSSYTTEKVPNWLEHVPQRNKTQNLQVYKPQTQVSQNTVVHLINTDLKKPNRTNVGSKLPQNAVRPIISAPSGSSSGPSSSFTSSGSGSYPPSLLLQHLLPSSSSSTTSKPGPNLHIGFTSYEENNKVPDEQVPQTPVVTYDQSCPTILINSYTRINNTIQSKQGCTDLNIIINSHVFNTNILKSTPSPTIDQSNNQNYQTNGEVDKYVSGGQLDSGSNYQSVPVYQLASSQWPQNGYYDPQKVPQTESLQQSDVSNVEVIQDTQISISSSGAEETPSAEVSLSEVESVTSLEDESGSSGLSGTEVGQLSDSSGANSLDRPANVPVSPSSGSPGDSSSSSANLPGGSSPPSRPVDDDYDDDFDLSPSGIMDSISSVFTYFTFVNPLHYGFFSLAAAPFTALAAGVLGIVTFIYPWLFPSSFSFSRAANNGGSDSFWSNLEEVVRQSMEKYGRMNEWKSKRKKRKR